MLKAVIFDHDGTLVDSESTHYQLWNKLLAQYGVSVSEDDYMRRYSGMPTQANARDLWQRFQLPITIDDLVRQKLAYSDAYLAEQGFPLMTGAKQAIHYFQALNLPLAVVTGAGRDEVRQSLTHHALVDAFKTIISCNDVKQGKPSPEGYLLALERLGVKASEALAFEDTEHGVNAAHAAGIPVIAIPNAMSERHDFRHASYVATGWQDAVEQARRMGAKACYF